MPAGTRRGHAGAPAGPAVEQSQPISPLVDAQKGSVEVKLALADAPPAALREDMTVSVEVATAERPSALVLPAGALRHDAQGREHVLLLQDGHARGRPVRTGLRTAEPVEIVEGLAARDQVLLEAALREGASSSR